jgi:hypothetical protein
MVCRRWAGQRGAVTALSVLRMRGPMAPIEAFRRMRDKLRAGFLIRI